MICFDNSVFSRYASRQSYPDVDRYLRDHSSERWLLPSMVLFEYLREYSVHSAIQTKRGSAEASVDKIVDMDADVAEEAANIDARLSAANTGLDVADLLIAATARANGATLTTRDKNDFDKSPIRELVGVDIID